MKQYVKDKIVFWADKLDKLDRIGVHSHDYYRIQGFITAYDDVLQAMEKSEESLPSMLDELKKYFATHTPEGIKADWDKYDTPENNTGPIVK